MSSERDEAHDTADLKTPSKPAGEYSCRLGYSVESPESSREREAWFFKRLHLVARLEPWEYLITECMDIIN